MPTSATALSKYLLRFDDLCPTMSADNWAAIEDVLTECNVKPIVSVVPDNRDPGLVVGPPDPNFWSRVRRWQSMGWSIGLHGYQHLYETRDAGILGLNQFSEFAGLPQVVQERKINNAIAILQAEGVRPSIWVAPGHSFDAVTVQVLKAAGIGMLSDGFFIYPHVDALGMMWVPQQIWRFRRVPFGVWTVCVHHNHWSNSDLSAFCRTVRRNRTRIVGLDQVSNVFREHRPSCTEKAFNRLLRSAVLAKIRRRRSSYLGPAVAQGE